MCVKQGDYKGTKENYCKWITFLSNRFILYLQEKNNMTLLKYFVQ